MKSNESESGCKTKLFLFRSFYRQKNTQFINNLKLDIYILNSFKKIFKIAFDLNKNTQKNYKKRPKKLTNKQPRKNKQTE